MNPTFNIPVTDEEATVAINLMQLGVKSCGGETFDQASASYLALRNKIITAKQAAVESEARAAAADKGDGTKDNVVSMAGGMPD